METLVTGGAGFIGSHLIRELMNRGHDVTVVDDFSHGERHRIPEGIDIVREDLTEYVPQGEYNIIFHLAARKFVNDDSPRSQFRENTEMTLNVLECALEGGTEKIIFTSSSTVYGEAPVPTSEDFAPLEPISDYGASKLACEGLLSSTAHRNRVDVQILRFANIVGSRLEGAVIPDFIEKLERDPETLEILGDGRQEKSYMYIDDCIEAMFHLLGMSGNVQYVNLGTQDTTSVDEIAEIVSTEMGLDPELEYTGGRQGWEGDVPKMRLSIEKLLSTKFSPELSSSEAVRRATQDLL